MAKSSGSNPKDQPNYCQLEGPPPLSDPGVEYEPLESKTKKELVDLCDSLGLSKRGNKDTLITNIQDYHTSIASIDTAEVREEESAVQEKSDKGLKSDKEEYSSKMNEDSSSPHQSEDEEM